MVHCTQQFLTPNLGEQWVPSFDGQSNHSGANLHKIFVGSPASRPIFFTGRNEFGSVIDFYFIFFACIYLPLYFDRSRQEQTFDKFWSNRSGPIQLKFLNLEWIIFYYLFLVLVVLFGTYLDGSSINIPSL